MHISDQIWDGKYRLKAQDGSPIDLTIEDTFRRNARALSLAEKAEGNNFKQFEWEEKFYDVLVKRHFSLAGRIIAGAGANRNVTLSNCYTMGTIGDSLDSIFTHLKEAALTMQAGGGIGYDFSTLRPKGAPVIGVGSDASGPLSFMDVWNAMCKTIMSAGSRRGAMMATMRCDHPDIEEFITAKREKGRLRHFNLSVLVTDAFMDAVNRDELWQLMFNDQVYKVIKARDLWNLIMDSTYRFAEPGVIFIDRVNQDHNLNYLLDKIIATTNPCGEQPMPPYSSCLLGSVNLARLVMNAFSDTAQLDFNALTETVRTAIRMMDNVIDVNRFPIPQQQKVALEERRLGLGITGLADALAMLGIRYGSPDAVSLTKLWMQHITLTAYEASCDLAEEKGSFPLFDAKQYLSGNTFANRKLPPKLKERIKKHGLRNSLLISIAPTGTISMFAGNVSSGIEPIFALSYKRNILNPDGTKRTEEVEDWAVSEFYKIHDRGTILPAAFVTAQELTPEDHLVMQGAAQEWVDSSISKTINLPEDISFEDFQAVYLRAYELGCKGCTTYRPNDVTGSVIFVEPKKEEKNASVSSGTSDSGATSAVPVLSESRERDSGKLAKRPSILPGAVHKIKLGGDDSVYLTITDIEEDGIVRPYEIFLNTKNPEHYQWSTALTRMVSAIFRRPHDSTFVVDELKQIFDPKGGGFSGGRYVPSLVAAIGIELEKHMKAIGYIKTADSLIQELPMEAPTTVIPTVKPLLCKACGSDNVRVQNGCPTCGDCGHSKCG